MKGKKIDIIGTPHQPEFLYKLIAFERKLNFDENAKLKSLVVTHNGFRFKTYADEILRNIQFWMIENDLEQAVGCARLLRFESGAANIFSNFPVTQAVFKEPEYDKAE